MKMLIAWFVLGAALSFFGVYNSVVLISTNISMLWKPWILVSIPEYSYYVAAMSVCFCLISYAIWSRVTKMIAKDA